MAGGGGQYNAPYRRVIWHLRSHIESGFYTPGTKVPSIRKLAKMYGVSEKTARHALHFLCLEGLIYARYAVGYYVAERPCRSAPQTLLEAARSAAWSKGVSSAEIARRLGKSRQSVGHLMSGRRPMSSTVYRKIIQTVAEIEEEMQICSHEQMPRQPDPA